MGLWIQANRVYPTFAINGLQALELFEYSSVKWQ